MHRPLWAHCALVFAAMTGTAWAQQGLYFSEDSNPNGLYSIDTSTGQATLLGASGVTSQTVGLAPDGQDDGLWGSSWTNLNNISTTGSGFTTVGTAGSEALAYDPATGTLYSFLNGTFSILDTAGTGVIASLPNPTGNDFEGLAWDMRRRVLWALPGFADADTHLWFYTPTDQQWHREYDTGIDWTECALAHDSVTDTLYMKNDGDTNLYAVDVRTGQLRTVGDMGISEGGGLAYIVWRTNTPADSAPDFHAADPGHGVLLRTERLVAPGQSLEIVAAGLPNTPMTLWVTGAGGMPIPLTRIATNRAGLTGRVSFALDVPTSLPESGMTLRAYVTGTPRPRSANVLVTRESPAASSNAPK